jgi:uncharacterized protein
VRLVQKWKKGGRLIHHFMFYSACQYLGLSFPKENKVNNSHMSALQGKHAELETKLDREETRPMPDSELINGLKKQKLHLKDLMSRELASA